MRLFLGFLVSVLIVLVFSQKTYAFDDYINEIAIPNNVTRNIQGVYEAYIVYSVSMVGENYQCVLARDGEPHQYPTRTLTFDPQWVMIGDTGYQDIPKPKVEPKVQPKVEPPVQTPEQEDEEPRERPRRPERPEKPEKPEKPEEPIIRQQPPVMPTPQPTPIPVMPKPEEPKPEEKPTEPTPPLL